MDSKQLHHQHQQQQQPLLHNINFDNLLGKIKTIKSKGMNVKMKNKPEFESTLSSTESLIEQNKNLFNSLQTEQNIIKIFHELNQTILDVESRLDKLSLIKFCRDKAEKYLSNVTQKLNNINMILLSFLAGNKKGQEIHINNQNEDLLSKINELNKKIAQMESSLQHTNHTYTTNNNNKDTFNSEKEKIYLGIKYLNGIDTVVNLKLAYDYFSEVASDNNANTEAKMLLASMYEKGLYVDKSYSKAFELYHDAYLLGSPSAAYKLGLYAENHFYDIKPTSINAEYSDDYENTAVMFYEKSANSGYTDALVRLGFIYETGFLGNETDEKKSIDYYKKAIELDDNALAHNGMGNYYYKKENYTLAIEHFKKGAQLGSYEALNNLGMCYEYGKGVGVNLLKAIESYRKANEIYNNSISLSNIAILMIKMDLNQGTACNYDECFRLLQLATHLDKTNKDAYYYLGFLFEIGYDLFGDGNVIQNPIFAFSNYKHAAELGHTKAKMKVGVAIYNGIEGCFTHDEIQGLNLLKEAANEGDKEANDYLQMLISNGKMAY